MSDRSLLVALERAVVALPDDVSLRLELADALLQVGRTAEALEHASYVLASDPGNIRAAALVRTLAVARRAGELGSAGTGTPVDGPALSGVAMQKGSSASPHEFDWSAAESDLDAAVAPMFVEGAVARVAGETAVPSAGVVLADVAGMAEVKQRIEASFLAPLRNPALAELYGITLRGGLLLYGPPGCGKTFLGKALAGELAAGFISVGIAEVLDMYLGESERNLQRLFERARRNAPTVLFFDEIDALGARRSSLGSSAMRTAVNQLLTELDGVHASNEGVYVVGATNAPWEVDPALRRPGRLDRTVLVAPPDAEARAAMFRQILSSKPVESIDVAELARRTDGYSGADLAHICQGAVEAAMMDSLRSGLPRLVTMADLLDVIGTVHPSVGPWMQSARNVVEFANTSGEFDELAAYLTAHKWR